MSLICNFESLGVSPIEKNSLWPKSLAIAECGAAFTFPFRESNLEKKKARRTKKNVVESNYGLPFVFFGNKFSVT